MKFIKNLSLWATLALSVILVSCEKEEKEVDPVDTETTGSFKLEFDHVFGTDAFALNVPFTNAFNEEVNFSLVKYYVSNIKLEKMDGTIWEQPESYYLIDVDNSGSMLLNLKDVPTGEYHNISFTLGVDSTRNVSGAQSGALDVANNMFWSWTTGYIFSKFEGNSPQAADNSFMYHVGGFSGENNALTQVSFQMHDHMLSVSPDASPQVHLMVDVAKLFTGMHDIQVANMSKVHMPGAMALHIAHNFNGAFSMDHIHD